MSGHDKLARISAIVDGKDWRAANRPPLSYRGRVAGAYFYDGAFDWSQQTARQGARQGDVLAAIREPDNPYDRHAIALWTFDAQVGHVPANVACDLAPLMDAGHPLWVQVWREAITDEPSNIEIVYFGPAIDEWRDRQ
ncbi:hypothetical protein A6A04_15995 [Paramagnetospirillum marisnigri]|uniref:HIRAN domain-containing protein n=1 Tax=Paramagnetospirillum marisnigri TaxID=1285242 RepID=A0A178MTD9_9PROT|nr:HIRAN domain-containing protein [Paramagnetospirillum marisnigri]OAN51421.1 hypothetical protein A6A04_15995 [Paramagnetospirillum marisnigri]